VTKFHRDSQTHDVKTRSSNTKQEAATQMARPDLCLSTEKDREVIPGEYFTSDQLLEVQKRSTLTIQCAVRQWFARREARSRLEARLEKARKAHDSQMARLRAEAEKEDVSSKPRSKQDFQKLQKQVDDWIRVETARIKHLAKDEAHFKELKLGLLRQEVKLLEQVERMRIDAHRANTELRIHTTLENMATPKTWKMSDGKIVETETQWTERAAQLKVMYDGLCLRGIKFEDREDILLSVRDLVSQYACKKSREIEALIVREIDMMTRRRPEASLGGLRKRIQTLFLEIIEKPDVNPEASHYRFVMA